MLACLLTALRHRGVPLIFIFVMLSYAIVRHMHGGVSVRLSVCQSVRLSHAGIDSKLYDHVVCSARDSSFYTNFRTLGPRQRPLVRLQTRLGGDNGENTEFR